MDLIVSGTGMVGGEACRLLAGAGRRVRALVRRTSDATRVEDLRRAGVEIVLGDLRDRESLRAACDGVASVLLTASSMPYAYAAGENTPDATDRDGALALIDAACVLGVRRFVYVSFPPMAATFPLQDAKRSVEDRLRASGLAWTVLQPTFFMEVWLSQVTGFDHVKGRAVVYGTGENAVSWISGRDVAKFAAACVGSSFAERQTLQLGGPDALTPLEVVRVFERVHGRRFDVTHLPVAELQSRLDAAVDPLERSFAGLMRSLPSSGPIDMSAALEAFGGELTSVEQHARRLVTP